MTTSFFPADPALHIQQLFSSDGVPYWILGHALLSDRQGSLESAITEISSNDVVDWSATWSGRWLLITPNSCILHASASLGLFRRVVDGALWLSSSVALLADRGERPASIPWDVAYKRRMDWIFAPLSSHTDITKLMPFRRLEMRTGQVSLISMPSLAGASQNPISEMADRLRTIAVNTRSLPYDDRRIGLTAGLDTRTILSAFVTADVPCQTVTNIYPGMREADKWLPPIIATSVGIPHALTIRKDIDQESVNRQRRIVERHVGGQTTGPTIDHCAHAENSDDKSRIFFGGLGFEVGRCYYWEKFGSTFDLLHYFHLDSAEPRWRKAMLDWIASLPDDIPLRMDWRDRFYLEQRLAGWASANHQCNDILPIVFFNPANCARLFKLMLVIPEQQRKVGFAQKEVIRALAPKLATHPINPQSWHTIAKGQGQAAKRLVRRAMSFVSSSAMTSAKKSWSRFLRQAAKVDSMTRRTIHHEDAQTVHG